MLTVPTCERSRQDARVPGPKAVVTTEIGKRIHERLGALNWSIRRLASEAGVSASMIVNWGKEERRDKSQADLDKVAEALGVTATWLVHGVDSIGKNGQMQFDPPEGVDDTSFERGLRLFLKGSKLTERVAFASKLEEMSFSGARSAEAIANAIEAHFAISRRRGKNLHIVFDATDDDPPPAGPPARRKRH
jgi:transcriptional regulator with XRE-family HTH domain